MIRPKECSSGIQLDETSINLLKFDNSHLSCCHHDPAKISNVGSVRKTIASCNTSSQYIPTQSSGLEQIECDENLLVGELQVSMKTCKPLDATTSECVDPLSKISAIPSLHPQEFHPERTMDSKPKEFSLQRHGVSRSRSMKMNKYDKKSLAVDYDPLMLRPMLRRSTDENIFKSFDTVAAAIFQEIPLRKTSTLLRQNTVAATQKDNCDDELVTTQTSLLDQKTRMKVLPMGISHTNKSSSIKHNTGIVDSWKRRKGFGKRITKTMDKGQVDFEMVVSAKYKASSLKENMGKIAKLKLPVANDECHRTHNSSYKDVNVHINDASNSDLEEGKIITRKNRCMDDSYTTDSKRIKNPNISNNFTISIADPQGDVTLVNTDPNGSFDNQEDAVCTNVL